jgi:hypothetical protein
VKQRPFTKRSSNQRSVAFFAAAVMLSACASTVNPQTGKPNIHPPVEKQPNVVTAEASRLITTTQLYANAGTPKFWGSRICELVSRDEIDKLFETQRYESDSVEPVFRFPSYTGESHETWSRSDCKWWDIGTITVLEGRFPKDADLEIPDYNDVEGQQNRFRGASTIPEESRPENAEGTCEPEPNTETNGWCERVRFVSVNGKNEKLFDSFDNVLPDPPDGDNERSHTVVPPFSKGRFEYIAVVADTKTIAVTIKNKQYGDPKKIAALIELLITRLGDLQPSTSLQQNPSVASLVELTESQLCALVTDETTQQLLNGKPDNLKVSKLFDLWSAEFECRTSRGSEFVTTKLVAVDSYKPIEVFEIRGHRALREPKRDAVILADHIESPLMSWALVIEFSRPSESTTSGKLIKDALTHAVTQLEAMGAMAPVPPEPEPLQTTSLPGEPEALPIPSTSEFPGETICGLLSDKDFALASGRPEANLPGSDLFYRGTATVEGSTTYCRKNFREKLGDSRTIEWAVSSNVSQRTLLNDPSCATATGCYRNKATRFRPANDGRYYETDPVGYTSVLPDGRYVEVLVERFEFKNLDDLTTLGNTLTKRLETQQFAPPTNAKPTVRSDQPEAQLCSLINSPIAQTLLGGAAGKLEVERTRYSTVFIGQIDSYVGRIDGSCKKTRNNMSISVDSQFSEAGYSTKPVALFNVGKYRILVDDDRALSGEIQLNGKLQLFISQSQTFDAQRPMITTKEQRMAFMAMMTEIAETLP